MNVKIEVSPGEIIDKITILEIKLSEISDENKLKNIRQEYALLLETYGRDIQGSPALEALKVKLRSTNQKIWESENDVREFWNDDVRFNAGAKQSHFYNDERARVKREINELLGSTIIEEKSHPKYEHKV